ncbi:MAG: DUF3393 domain-containing protein [Methylocystaceae bacterium]|nr:DUF3393 domain-containing protein [Methylocystaceae bacterium]
MSFSFKHMIFASVFSTMMCASPVLYAQQDDWLDRMDAQFEETYQKTDAAFDKAMAEGVKDLDRELTSIWGEARALPEPKVWVGYSKDRKTRIVVDYERGEMSIEGFDRSERELTQEFQDILLEDTEKLNERAILRRKLIDTADRFWKDQNSRHQDKPRFVPRPAPKQDQTSTRVQNHELSSLIAPRSRPQFVKRSVRFGGTRQVNFTRLSIPLRKDRDQLSAVALRTPIEEVSDKYGLPASLILSVIKNESAFNPRARSHANALGLMQLVATSGGKEAYTYLMGYEATPNPRILYDPHENIKLGATYLYLLKTRYFGKVKDPKTRLYLTIAAYNTGPGNVAKAFTGKMKLKGAIAKINTMSAQEIYRHLLKNLPYQETKTYLARVSKDLKTFANWDA